MIPFALTLGTTESTWEKSTWLLLFLSPPTVLFDSKQLGAEMNMLCLSHHTSLFSAPVTENRS